MLKDNILIKTKLYHVAFVNIEMNLIFYLAKRTSTSFLNMKIDKPITKDYATKKLIPISYTVLGALVC